MTRSAAAVSARRGEDDATRLWKLLPPAFLEQMLWNAARETITFPVGHTLFVDGRDGGPSRARGSRGTCLVDKCPEQSVGRYCPAHRGQWIVVKRMHPHIDEMTWRATVRADLHPGEIDLRGIAPLAVAELLTGLSERYSRGAQTRLVEITRLARVARYERVRSLRDVDVHDEGLRNVCVIASDRALLDPDTERTKDTWAMSAFGYGGTLRFGEISQRWLREAVKLWAYDFLPTRRGNNPIPVVQDRVSAMVRLSESLRLHRDDNGENYLLLSAADITSFCNRLAYLHSRGEISARLRLISCLRARVVLDGLRKMGPTRPGGLLAGLPEDFALRRGQMPDETEDDEPGRDLPKEVMRVICDHLSKLGHSANREIQTAVELLIDTGRRPGEICALPLDCLHYDSQDQPVLVYDNIKARRFGRRLPIATATAELIRAQQARVRARYPQTPTKDLKLLPTSMANPDGRRGFSSGHLTNTHRRWLQTLPPVTVATETLIDGKTELVALPFDITTVSTYAYRHTYAQRHADAGVPVDVLRELLDHLRMDTTQRYYNPRELRLMSAIRRSPERGALATQQIPAAA